MQGIYRNLVCGIWGALLAAQAFADGDIYQSTPIDYRGAYTFISAISGSCLDVTDRSLASGMHLQQWACSGEPNQAFRFLKSGEDVYIRAVQSKLFLRTDADRFYVIQYDSPRPTYHAEWRFEPGASTLDAYQIRFRDSDTCMSVELFQGLHRDGSAVILSPCMAFPHQLWYIRKKP